MVKGVVKGDGLRSGKKVRKRGGLSLRKSG